MNLKGVKSYTFKSGFRHELELGGLRDTLARARAMVTEPHRADFHQIVWVRSGRARLLLDLETIPMTPGSLLCIRKNRVLMYDRASAYDGLVLRFTDGFFARSAEDARFLQQCCLFRMDEEAPLVHLDRRDATLPALVDLLRRELARPDDAWQHAALRGLLHAFLIHAGRGMEARPSPEPVKASDKAAGQAFLDRIETGFRTEKKIAAYARMLGMSEKRLQAATAGAFGKSPKSMLDARVALEAKRLLLHGSDSVKEISFALGFDEVTNFVKWFRKHAQATPAAFRARYRP